MVSEVTVGRTQLNPKEMSVEMKELASNISGWLEAYNYDPEEESYKFEVGATPEEIKDLDIRINGFKNIDNYTRFKIETAIQMAKAKRVKEKVGNKTVELIKGEGKIVLLSKLIFDFDNRWAKDRVLHYLRGIYERYFYFQTKKTYIGKILGEVASIESELKRFLKLE